jgi:hypothetical protein
MSSSTPVVVWTWPTWVVSRRCVLEVVFVLLESTSPSRRIFIGSHSLPPLWFAVLILQRTKLQTAVRRAPESGRLLLPPPVVSTSLSSLSSPLPIVPPNRRPICPGAVTSRPTGHHLHRPLISKIQLPPSVPAAGEHLLVTPSSFSLRSTPRLSPWPPRAPTTSTPGAPVTCVVRLCPTLTKGRRKPILLLGSCRKMYCWSYILCLASFPQNPLERSHFHT